jgi:HlyD family secretion protein
MKRWILIGSIVIVVAIVLFVGRQSSLRAEQAVGSVEVARGTVVQEAVALGSIVPEQENSVKSKLPGIVDQVYVEVGDFVREGDPLIDIRPDPTPLERAQAERNLQIARVAEEGAERELARARELHEQKLLSERELEVARQEYDTARLSAELAAETLDLLKSGRASIEGQEVDSRITAPASGTILTIEAHAGDPVVPLTSYQEGTVLITMADMTKLIFKGTVDEVDVGKLTPEQIVEFTVGALPDAEVLGRLIRISPKARREGTTTLFDVEAEITDAGGNLLRAGYSATARISIERAEDVLVLPERVVQYDGDSASVRLPGEGETPRIQPITTGLSDGLTVEVRAGLAEGDQVLEAEPSSLER